jgi:hypothetical protein
MLRLIQLITVAAAGTVSDDANKDATATEKKIIEAIQIRW